MGVVRWTKETAVASIRWWRATNNRVPVANDFRTPSLPSLPTLKKLFGGWECALSAAFPVDDSKERSVVINGQVHLYDAKAPFENSGKSIRGAIEYNPAAGALKCHECGEFVRSLANHVKRNHSITAREYKLRHGLRIKTALVRDSVRLACSASARLRASTCDPYQARLQMKKISALGNHRQQGRSLSATTAERHNARGRCRMQTLEKIKRVAAVLQKTPTIGDLVLNGVPYHDIEYHFGTVRNAQMLAGLIPNSKATGGKTKRLRISEDFLIKALRVFYYSHKRLPRITDTQRGLIPCSAGPFYVRFGGWFAALEIAFSPEEIAADPFWGKRKAVPA